MSDAEQRSERLWMARAFGAVAVVFALWATIRLGPSDPGYFPLWGIAIVSALIALWIAPPLPKRPRRR